MKLLTQIAVIMLVGFALSAAAHGVPVLSRVWAIQGAGGYYGFVESDLTPSASIYSVHDLETSVCLGPISVSFPFSAPITVCITFALFAGIAGLGSFVAPSKRARERRA
jgi:hypothetical protein